jgi:hypothetical protein
MKVIFNDGGREAAGYRGRTGDCVVRAFSIAADLDYREVYKRLSKLQGRSVRQGVHTNHCHTFAREIGWVWVPLMGFGTGTRVNAGSPILERLGRGVVRTSHHLFAVVDGEVHDTYDPTRLGNRCVYGVWVPPGESILDDLKSLSADIKSASSRGERVKGSADL